MLDPTPPLHEGGRVVAIQNAVVARSGEDRQTLHYYLERIVP
jgi:hypothetical protein